MRKMREPEATTAWAKFKRIPQIEEQLLSPNKHD
jgi:hypothetical protein